MASQIDTMHSTGRIERWADRIAKAVEDVIREDEARDGMMDSKAVWDAAVARVGLPATARSAA